MIVDKRPEGTRSPNMADATVMAYWPVGGVAFEFPKELMDWATTGADSW